MQLLDRRDGPLAIALCVGMFVMFTQPLRNLLSVAEEVSRTYHVDLVPGLGIFVLVFTVHYWRKHRDATFAAALSARTAEDAQRESAAMQQLIAASHRMNSAADWAGLRSEALHLVPGIVVRPCWAGVAHGGGWRWLLDPPPESRESLVDLSPTLLQLAAAGERRHNEWRLFPLTRGDRVTGLLAVDQPEALSPIEEGRLAALAMMLGVGVKNVQLFEQLQANSSTDSLTGCSNRAHAFDRLQTELRRCRRNNRPLSVVMMDVDRFKSINDDHGHLSGDAVLQAIGDTLQRTLRTSDVKCRYGGDEFLAILPETSNDSAEQVAIHLRRAIEQIEVPGKESHVLSCRISMGVATSAIGETDGTQLIARADEALYRDKRRNVVRLVPADATGELSSVR